MSMLDPEPLVDPVLSWSEVYTICQSLAHRMRPVPPDTIVGIARGGLAPAAILSHMLGVRDVRSVQVACTASDYRDATRLAEVTVGDPASIGNLTGRSVLIVDDIVTTGRTMARVQALCGAAGTSIIRTAVLALKSHRPTLDSVPRDLTGFGVRCVGWVTFPWETEVR
ncbi:phosphoribosyltransferase [Micromonospora arida]|uniref:phosphoribosyltransferase n=1 Tax=Micromonospora arida TaxID=2203715 RepID=UPI0033EE8973